VFDGKSQNPVHSLVMDNEDLELDENAVIETDHKLSEYFPVNKYSVYTYDMGDNWEHLIELARVIDNHGSESPYLLEATGPTPPEDVGGVGGYIEFLKIMSDPTHEEYSEAKQWAGYWSPDLEEWRHRPGVMIGGFTIQAQQACTSAEKDVS
jgi:hypothetical protein